MCSQAHLLKLREKALIDKTNAELTWLEQMKKKVQDKGEDEKMPSILKKEKGIMQKLKEEQVCLSFLTEIFYFKLLNFEIVSFCKGKYQSAEGGAATGHRESPQNSVPTFGGHQMVPEQAQEAAANTSRFAGRLELQGKQRAAEQDRFEWERGSHSQCWRGWAAESARRVHHQSKPHRVKNYETSQAASQFWKVRILLLFKNL